MSDAAPTLRLVRLDLHEPARMLCGCLHYDEIAASLARIASDNLANGANRIYDRCSGGICREFGEGLQGAGAIRTLR